MKKLIYCAILTLISCSQRQKAIEIKEKTGVILKGLMVCDSLWNGKVEMYDKNEKLIGYRTYKMGVEDGWSVGYDNGHLSDSIHYSNGRKNGFAYSLGSNGMLQNKSFFYENRMLGSVCDFDSIGKLLHYYFYSFEGGVIFEVDYKDSIRYIGQPIRAKMRKWILDGRHKDIVFLYLIHPPHTDSHYEIVVIDKNKEVISSKRIDESSFFYENVLDSIPGGQSYAIGLYVLNKSTGKYDLTLKTLED